MRLTKYSGYARPPPVPTMPPGLVELMEGLTKEVLKNNPPDVYEFCANHIEKLLEIRDGRAPRKTLTLEEKINRAQQKVKERAEQRRRKYDEEMKKYVAAAVTESSSNSLEEPTPDKLKSPEYVQDNKLKAPVHHEQDLTDALEVEIFQKPVKDANIEKVFATNFESITITNNGMDNSEKSSEEKKRALDSDETINATDAIVDNNKSFGIDKHNNIIESDKDAMPAEHIRVQRSIASEDLNEPSEKTSLELDIKETAIEKPQEEAILLNHFEAKAEAVEKNENEEMEVSSVPVTNIKDAVEQFNDTLSNDDDMIDQVEKLVVLNEPENDNIKGEVKTETQNEDNFVKNFVISTTEPSEEVNMEIESAGVQIDTNLDKSNKIVDEAKEETTQIVEPTEEIDYKNAIISSENEDKVEEILSENETTVDEKANCKLNVSVEFVKPIDVAVVKEMPPENENVTERVEESKHVFAEAEEIGNNTCSQKEQQDMKSKTEISHRSTELQNTDKVSVSLSTDNAELLTTKEEISSVEMSTPISKETSQTEELKKENAVSSEIESSNTESNYQVTTENDVAQETAEVKPFSEISEHTESGNNTNVKDIKRDNATTSENCFETEENGDGSVTTVNKVLVDESAVVKDDNDSIPDPTTDTTSHVTEQNVNGTSENGKTTPDSEVIINVDESPNEQITKNVFNISEIQDNMSNASQSIKTENEPSSIESRSSCSKNDNFIDDSDNSTPEVDLNDTNSESTQNKDSSSHMDLETAAVTIQKVFRSFLFKSRGSTFDDSGADGNSSIDNDSEKVEVQFPISTTSINKERRTLGISRMDTVLQTVNEEKSLSLSTDDSSLSSAATIIQAHVRGFLVRNRHNSNKSDSTSLVNSDYRSTSLEADSDKKSNKTILNIHIVPEGEHFISRDESLLTSIDLSLDGSPPSSTNLHPLGYDKSEPRKQLKREDAIQSISPPSNNSGKLSEDLDSLKDMIVPDEQQKDVENLIEKHQEAVEIESRDDTPTRSTTIETVIEAHALRLESNSPSEEENIDPETGSRVEGSVVKYNSDESDVVTPFEEQESFDSGNTSRLLHSGEFHDIVLPTKISRSDTSVVRGE